MSFLEGREGLFSKNYREWARLCYGEVFTLFKEVSLTCVLSISIRE